MKDDSKDSCRWGVVGLRLWWGEPGGQDMVSFVMKRLMFEDQLMGSAQRLLTRNERLQAMEVIRKN